MITERQEMTERHDLTAGNGMRDVRAYILDALRKKRECELEELVRVCPSFTWNQVFLEVDRLSRTGELNLLARRAGEYTVRLPVYSSA